MNPALTRQLKLESAITDSTIKRAITKLWDLPSVTTPEPRSPTYDDWKTAMQVYLDDYFENQPSSPDTDFLPTPSSDELEIPLKDHRHKPKKTKRSNYRVSKFETTQKNTTSRHSMTTRSRTQLSDKLFHLDMPPSRTRTTKPKKKVKR